MDGAEAIAETFLRPLGFSDIAHEPDGNIPPDFAINCEIAVEVRRLNQADWGTGSPQGLENASYPLVDQVQRMLKEFGCCQGRSYWVSYTFFRPLASWKEIYPAINDSLLKITQSRTNRPMVIRPHPSIEFRIDPTSEALHQTFNLGAFSDTAAGGAVVAEMIKHIEYYIGEKAKKIRPHKDKYASWWLLLIDYIGYGLRPEDQLDLKKHVERTSYFEKVFVVSPHVPYTGFEI